MTATPRPPVRAGAAALPRDADDVTASWLTHALRPRYPNVKVAQVHVLDRHELTNAHARLQVTYQRSGGAPETVFLKLPPLDPDRRDSIVASGMGRREALFYAHLAPSLSMRLPAAHVALTDDVGEFVLVLEDLVSSGCAVSDGTWGVPPDAAAGALHDLAELHARFEHPATRAAVAPWAPVNRPSNAYGAPMLQHGVTHHRDRLSDAFVQITDWYVHRHDALQEIWHRGPHTLIHGDPHIGNLFMDGDRVGFLDWGIINVNTPMRDVSYLLTMAMNVEDRRNHERELLQHYLAEREAMGASAISLDEAWLAHRQQAAYNVPASCQVVLFPDDASPRRQVFADAFLERALVSIDDLESVQALREAGI